MGAVWRASDSVTCDLSHNLAASGSIMWPLEPPELPLLSVGEDRLVIGGTIMWPKVTDWKHILAVSSAPPPPRRTIRPFEHPH
jgi:hypothetical protein